MSEGLFDSTSRLERIVGREQELEAIKYAISTPGKQCRVVLVTGEGGLGKTRLLEETLINTGRTPLGSAGSRYAPTHVGENRPWEVQSTTYVGDIVDLSDIRLSARGNFMQALRNALAYPGGPNFERYDASFIEMQQAAERGADYSGMQALVNRVETHFVADLRANASKRRIVLLLDTAERLALLPSSIRLLDGGILKAGDLLFSSRQWLVNHIGRGDLANITLIISGRDGRHEGDGFYDELKRISDTGNVSVSFTRLDLDVFNEEDCRIYFERAIDQWRRKRNANSANSFEYRISSSFDWIASDPDAIRVLSLYSGGRPVLLALYAAVLIESPSPPDALVASFDDAKARIDAEGYQRVRAEIESELIRLLFIIPSTRAAILQALVRSPRGLSPEQLHFVLDSFAAQDPAEWTPDTRRISELESESLWGHLLSLSIVKARPNGRIGLQDEIHRIYAERMAESEKNRKDERDARRQQYLKLYRWAKFQQKRCESERRQFQDKDERLLDINSPARALSVTFPLLGEIDQMERNQVYADIQSYEIEGIHYALLLDPASALNEAYFDLGERKWIAGDEDADYVAQMEMWRALNDNASLKFVDIDENRLQTLRFAAEHDDATRWIMRFIARGSVKRAIDFYETLERDIESIRDDDERRRWQHTFGRGERFIWYTYARIMTSIANESAIDECIPVLKDLAKLAGADVNETVFEDRGVLGIGEKGFIGHPALTRLHRVIAIGFNYIGYGCAQLGRFRKAVDYYSKALFYMRQTNSRSLQAATRNNLARSLTELGRGERGRRICLDGLRLRREQGALIPFALSLNTLALIDNHMRRADLAWIESVKALAYFRRAGMKRGQGLALLELSKSLRRYANQDQMGLLPADPVDRIYAQAEWAAGEAFVIFTDTGSSASSEVSRKIEAYIELGCVKRDQLRSINSDATARYVDRKEVLLNKALIYLQQAQDEAAAIGLHRHELDAAVNIAWAYYYAGEYEMARHAANAAEDLVDSAYKVHEGSPPPAAIINESYIYSLLSKASSLQGRLRMDLFIQEASRLTAEIVDHGAVTRSHAMRRQRQDIVHSDVSAQDHLRHAANAFVRALCYAELFSPRSTELILVYDHLYEYLKRFNVEELEDFRSYQSAARELYQVSKTKVDDLSDLDEWLEQCFGPERENEHIFQ